MFDRCSDCKRHIPDCECKSRPSNSKSALSALLCWLADLQKNYPTIIHFKLSDDGSGAIVHTPYDEEEIIKYWDNLEELFDLMETA